MHVLAGVQVRLAAAVVLENAVGHVLLTRRAAHMRTFPHAWVRFVIASRRLVQMATNVGTQYSRYIKGRGASF
jgi:isopentenyldiphosphate isomerase